MASSAAAASAASGPISILFTAHSRSFSSIHTTQLVTPTNKPTHRELP